MERQRNAQTRIRTARQLRVLTSPIAIEVVESLQAHGPSTVTQIGTRLGRRANSLYYHVTKLVDAGLIRKVGQRQSGARTQAVYDVVSQRITGKTVPKQRRLRDLTVRAVAATLRHAARDFERASESGSPVEDGRHRSILMNRHKAWLTPKQLENVNRHIDALRLIFAEGTPPQGGTLCALTMVLTPLSSYEESD